MLLNIFVVGAGGPRKAKRVSDVSAMGAPSPAPSFSPTAPYNPGYPQSAPAPFQQGIQLDTSQGFGPSEPAGSKFMVTGSKIYLFHSFNVFDAKVN